jgi:hypothetical protein
MVGLGDHLRGYVLHVPAVVLAFVSWGCLHLLARALFFRYDVHRSRPTLIPQLPLEASMRHALLLGLLALAVLSGGCTRPVCGMQCIGLDPKLSASWEPLKELIPPAATVCGHYTGSDQHLEKMLVIDFEENNPFVTIVQHLEDKGFKRVSQKIDNADFQTATLKRENLWLVLSTHREKGRVFAELSLSL